MDAQQQNLALSSGRSAISSAMRAIGRARNDRLRWENEASCHSPSFCQRQPVAPHVSTAIQREEQFAEVQRNAEGQ